MTITDHQSDLGTLVQRWTTNDPEILQDPYPFLARLRVEQPVFDTGSQVLVARHADAKAALLDSEALSNKRFNTGSYADDMLKNADDEQRSKVGWVRSQMDTWLATMDGAEHAELRRIVNPSFVATKIADLRPAVQTAVSGILDQIDARGEPEFDFVSSFSDHLPVSVICSFIGVPIERGPEIRQWSKTLAEAVYTQFANYREVYDAYGAFGDCIRTEIERRRHDSEIDDLLAHLITGNEGDRELDEDEIVSFGMLLLFGGHETTTNLLGNSLVSLLRHPDQMADLRAELSGTRRAVDEFLRYSTSVHTMPRVAIQETQIGDKTIAPGTTVRIMLGSANHDETVFERSEDFDIHRKDARKHLGFGYGIHGCIGMHLARLEIEIAVSTILERYPNLHFAGPVEIDRNFSLYGPAKLPLGV
jgi:cytochrome P450